MFAMSNTNCIVIQNLELKDIKKIIFLQDKNPNIPIFATRFARLPFSSVG